jgi:hypothetical protein
MTTKYEDMTDSSNEPNLYSTGEPNKLEPVLALINHQGYLGMSEWYEVVYFFQKWRSYTGSKTFEDGEQVVKWKYAKDCL